MKGFRREKWMARPYRVYDFFEAYQFAVNCQTELISLRTLVYNGLITKIGYRCEHDVILSMVAVVYGPFGFLDNYERQEIESFIEEVNWKYGKWTEAIYKWGVNKLNKKDKDYNYQTLGLYNLIMYLEKIGPEINKFCAANTEIDEDDLLGVYRNRIYGEEGPGPIIDALRKGESVLIDEIPIDQLRYV